MEEDRVKYYGSDIHEMPNMISIFTSNVVDDSDLFRDDFEETELPY